MSKYRLSNHIFCRVTGSRLLSSKGSTMHGYFLWSHRKNAGIPMVTNGSEYTLQCVGSCNILLCLICITWNEELKRRMFCQTKTRLTGTELMVARFAISIEVRLRIARSALHRLHHARGARIEHGQTSSMLVCDHRNSNDGAQVPQSNCSPNNCSVSEARHMANRITIIFIAIFSLTKVRLIA